MPAVDDELAPRYPGRFIGRKVKAAHGDIDGLADPPARAYAVTPAIAPPVIPSVSIETTIRPHRRRVLPLFVTLITVAFAFALGRGMWDAYMGRPWTRDATVRAYVVTMAPAVPGRIVGLPVADNQFVHKDDPLVVIDPTNYAISVRLGEAAVQQALANLQKAQREAKRREKLPDFAVSVEQQQNYETQAVTAQAQYQQAAANLDQARANLERTIIRSTVNGWVTNLMAQRGDFASAGQNLISVVDADSFWSMDISRKPISRRSMSAMQPQ